MIIYPAQRMIFCILVFISLSVSFIFGQPRDNKDQSILIVGAGAAGLSAATKLHKNGYHNITILEAESRIGGRINSVYFGNNYIDLGARWCHGKVDNVVFSMAKDLVSFQPTPFPEKFFQSTGAELDDKFGMELWDVMDDIYLSDADYPIGYETYGDYCSEQYNKTIHEKFGNDERKLKVAKDAVDFFEMEILTNEGSTSWYDTTARSDFEECEGEQLLNWRGGGYKTFLEILLEKFPDDSKITEIEKKILFNKEVSKINWNSTKKTQGVVVSCSDNTQFTADHVIVTASLGVLKERKESLFSPPLPIEKRRAIDVMGFGPVMKIAVFYSKKWWKDDCHGFNFIWTSEDREKSILEFPEGPHINNRSWVTYIPYILRADNNSNVLMVWVSGPLIPKIEQLSDDILTKGVIYVTNKFLGHIHNVSHPDKILHSNWYSNPHFRGSYSFQTVEAKRGHKSTNAQEDLAVPIKNDEGRPFLHFAGEATHPRYYSNVHGAVESGFREADVIMNYYKK